MKIDSVNAAWKSNTYVLLLLSQASKKRFVAMESKYGHVVRAS